MRVIIVTLYLLAAVLVVLKLCGVIAVSWWLVFLPALVGFGLAMLFALVVYLGVFIMASGHIRRSRF